MHPIAAAIHVPAIETDRLRLRGHRVADFSDCASMWADPLVTRYIGGRPFTEEESWARLLRYAGHWALLGFGFWAIEEKQTGRFAGELGFANFKRGIDPAFEAAPELGWVLRSEIHGRGYATEAVRAALAWGDRHFADARTVCLIDPANLQSLRVAEKCGYREFRQVLYKDRLSSLFIRWKTHSSHTA